MLGFGEPVDVKHKGAVAGQKVQTQANAIPQSFSKNRSQKDFFLFLWYQIMVIVRKCSVALLSWTKGLKGPAGVLRRRLLQFQFSQELTHSRALQGITRCCTVFYGAPTNYFLVHLVVLAMHNLFFFSGWNSCGKLMGGSPMEVNCRSLNRG